MTEALLIAAAVLATGVAGLLVYAWTRPDTFHFERARVIAAPAERIYPLIADMRALNTWNPFAADPSLKGTYSGPAAGVGAAYAFESTRAGTGNIAITDTTEPHQVGLRLVMTRPMACDNRIEYRLEPAGSATRVTWAMSGRSSFPAKLMCAFMNPDRMCGDMFDKGLRDLAVIAERPAAEAA